MSDDMKLVSEFAAGRSEPAFTALVERHVGLVHSAALRQTGDPHLAEEITQAVFIILARKAATLGRDTILPAWLYRTTRYTAANALKIQHRRRVREQEACMQSTMQSEDTANAWQQLAPLLDDTMSELSESDRASLVLRYFENRPWREVAMLMQVTEDAAQKRVTRALDKLRFLFAKRGVTITVAAIAAALSANSVKAAPAGMTKIISSVVAAKGATATISTLALVKGGMKTMLWSNLKMALIAGGAIILATAGTMSWFASHSETDVAKIPYRILEQGWLFEQSINPTNLTFHFLIGSNKKNVRSQDIHLTIQSASKGNIVLRLGGKGQMLDFPSDDDLHRENPLVVSDQPKGTLGFGYWIYVPRPEGLTFRYDHLANAVDEANKAIAHAREISKSESGPGVPIFYGVVNGVGFNFPKASAGKANLTLMTAEGAKNYVADSQGVIKLKINPQLRTENPRLIFSERPDWIGIASF